MSVELRSDKQNIFLIGLPSHQINGAKLPSIRQVFAVLFYNIREVKLTVSESANLVIRECIIFWKKARIPTKAFPNCVKKLVDLYHVWRELQKNCKKTQDIYKNRQNNFEIELDNLFDIAHADAFERMKIEEDKEFLRKQREPGRPGCLGGVDKKLADKEERCRQRRLDEEERKNRQRELLVVASTSSTHNLEDVQDPDEEPILDSEVSLPEIPCPEISSKRGRKNLITPNVVTVHSDGKLLPGLNVRSSKEERLPIIASFDDGEQLLAVPKLESSSGKYQAKAISTALFDWNLNDKVQILCCDTTASNTGHFNGACALLEKTLERELVLFACRHHVYELVLKTVFETKIKEVTSSPDIPIFKKFREKFRKNIDSNAIELCLDFVKEHVTETNITSLLMFYKEELDKSFIRDDYRELVELCIVFLGGDLENKIKIKPPGAMQQARWMARAIYSLKICLLQSQFRMIAKDKKALQDVCLFIVTLFVKPWLECSVAIKAPNQDLCFLKALKDYEKVDATVSKVALSKFTNHLWYLSEETVILSLFDNEVDNQTKMKMIANLNRDKISDFGKRYIPSKEETSQTLFDKTLDDFVSEKSKQLISRLQIDDNFLQEDVSSWNDNTAILEAKRRVSCLKVVNDTAERAVKLMQDFHGLITTEEEQKQFLLRCVQEHRNLYPDCKKHTLKKNYPG